MKLIALTLLILEINHLIDLGKYDIITIEEIYKAINDGTILRYLKEKVGNDIDLSIHLNSKTFNDFESWYVEHLQSLYDAYSGDENRKWGVQNKGLCLLLAWTNEIIQQGSCWVADENISKR
jgi:hypothetical protein